MYNTENGITNKLIFYTTLYDELIVIVFLNSKK